MKIISILFLILNAVSLSFSNSNDLYDAIADRDITKLEEQIKKGGNLNKDSDNDVPLIKAIQFSNMDAVELLLQKGANPNSFNDYGDSPIANAVGGKQKITFDLLLQYKANIKLTNSSGDSLFYNALNSGSLDMLQLLINHKLDVNHQNNSGDTPLHQADRKSVV